MWPGGFCWAMQDIYEAIEDGVEWQSWYLDDVHFGGYPGAAAYSITKIGEDRRTKRDKSEIWEIALIRSCLCWFQRRAALAYFSGGQKRLAPGAHFPL